MPRSDLPFGSEFSPSQVDLARVLELAKEHSGDWKTFERVIRAEYFEGHKTSDHNKSKLANNTKLGMIAYGIYNRESSTLTPLGEKLYSIRKDKQKLYTEFAQHILLNLHGITLVQCVQDMQAGGETVDLVSLRHWLEERGIHFPRGGKHPSMMRLWLEKAAIFVSGWQVNEAKVQEILGSSLADVDVLSTFTPEQRAYLKTIANFGSAAAKYSSNEIEKAATATYGVKFNEKNLPKDVLYPLEKAGFITLERGTKAAGRGAKPFIVKPTEKLNVELILPALNQLEKQVGSELRPFLKKPLSEVLKELNGPTKHIRGLALEALAIKLMRLIDLNYIATRLQGSATGGAEVDVIFDSSRHVFSRWQVQCKNTSRVSLDDVAKEVGLTHFLKSNVIVVVTTGEVGSEARRYANKIMAESNLAIAMIDGKDIGIIEKDPSMIVDILNREVYLISVFNKGPAFF